MDGLNILNQNEERLQQTEDKRMRGEGITKGGGKGTISYQAIDIEALYQILNQEQHLQERQQTRIHSSLSKPNYRLKIFLVSSQDARGRAPWYRGLSFLEEPLACQILSHYFSKR
jgi:hypothetical protein